MVENKSWHHLSGFYSELLHILPLSMLIHDYHHLQKALFHFPGDRHELILTDVSPFSDSHHPVRAITPKTTFVKWSRSRSRCSSLLTTLNLSERTKASAEHNKCEACLCEVLLGCGCLETPGTTTVCPFYENNTSTFSGCCSEIFNLHKMVFPDNKWREYRIQHTLCVLLLQMYGQKKYIISKLSFQLPLRIQMFR